MSKRAYHRYRPSAALIFALKLVAYGLAILAIGPLAIAFDQLSWATANPLHWTVGEPHSL